MSNVYEKLLTLRKKVHDAGVKKTGHNTYSKLEYVTLGDFLPKVLAACVEIKLIGIISFDKETAILTIKDIESEGEIKFTSPMSSANLKGCHDVQNLGATQTYLRRYLWINALDLIESDPLDESNPDENDAAAAEREYKNFLEFHYEIFIEQSKLGTKNLVAFHKKSAKTLDKDLYGLFWSAKSSEFKQIAAEADKAGEENGTGD